MKKLLFLITIVAFVSCKNNNTQQITNTPENQAQIIENYDVEITLEGDDRMLFNKTEIKVKAGQKIKLTLKHTGRIPKNAMGHNFVLLKQGTEISTFGMNAMKAAENQYIPEGGKDVIAHTDMIGGGETTSVIFDAPAVGVYDFICSFPGHYTMMKGKFIVE